MLLHKTLFGAYCIYSLFHREINLRCLYLFVTQHVEVLWLVGSLIYATNLDLDIHVLIIKSTSRKDLS